jgi:hypothetical protein
MTDETIKLLQLIIMLFIGGVLIWGGVSLIWINRRK